MESHVPSSELEAQQTSLSIKLRFWPGDTLTASPADTDQTLVGVRSPAAGSTVAVTAVAGLWTATPPAALLSALQLGDYGKSRRVGKAFHTLLRWLGQGRSLVTSKARTDKRLRFWQ